MDFKNAREKRAKLPLKICKFVTLRLLSWLFEFPFE